MNKQLIHNQAERIFSAVSTIDRALENDHFGAESDLTRPQLKTLISLSKIKRCTMSELGRLTGYPNSALTGIIDRMIRKKLVSRVRDDNDRRIVHVTVTPGGSKLAGQFRRRIMSHTTIVLEKISATEREKMIILVEKIADTFAHKNSPGEKK